MIRRGLQARLRDAVHALRGRPLPTPATAPPPPAAAAALAAKAGGDPPSAGEARMAALLGGGSGVSAAGSWQSDRAEQLRHYRHWVYTCVNFLAAKVASTPPRVGFAVDPDDAAKHLAALKAYSARRTRVRPPPRRLVPPAAMKAAAGGFGPGEQLEYAGDDHPLRELLANPNGPDTGATFWREAVIYFKLCGANYTWKVPGEGGGVSELWHLPAHWVTPVAGRDRLVDRYEVRAWGASGAVQVFDADEIIEVKDPNPLNKLAAQSPLQANAEVIDQYESVQAARYWQLKNGANIGAAIQLAEGASFPDAKELLRMQAEFEGGWGGEGAFHRPKVLPPGAALLRPDYNAEIAFRQSADQGRDYVVSQCFRLSKTALGVTEGVPWATFVGEMRRVVQDVINPELALFGGVFTEKLAKDYGPDLRVWWELQSPADDQQRLAEWSAGMANGSVARNEFRTHVLNLDPLDDPAFDVPMEQAGMVPGGGADAFDGDGDDPAGGRGAYEEPGSSGEGLFKAAPRPGLVLDPASHRWERPGGGDDAPTPARGGPHPEGRAGLRARLASVGSKALRTRVGRFVAAAEHRLSIVAHKTRDVAALAAEKRGHSPEKAERLRRTLAVADFAGGYVTGVAAAVALSPAAGKAAAFLPSVSALYVGYSAAVDPAATWAAARHVVAATLAGKAAPAPDAAGGEHWLAEWIGDNVAGDWHEALFLACLAETEDAGKACELFARAAARHPEQPDNAPAPSAADFGLADDAGKSARNLRRKSRDRNGQEHDADGRFGSGGGGNHHADDDAKPIRAGGGKLVSDSGLDRAARSPRHESRIAERISDPKEKERFTAAVAERREKRTAEVKAKREKLAGKAAKSFEKAARAADAEHPEAGAALRAAAPLAADAMRAGSRREAAGKIKEAAKAAHAAAKEKAAASAKEKAEAFPSRAAADADLSKLGVPPKVLKNAASDFAAADKAAARESHDHRDAAGDIADDVKGGGSRKKAVAELRATLSGPDAYHADNWHGHDAVGDYQEYLHEQGYPSPAVRHFDRFRDGDDGYTPAKFCADLARAGFPVEPREGESRDALLDRAYAPLEARQKQAAAALMRVWGAPKLEG